jgi:hypothetical protein
MAPLGGSRQCPILSRSSISCYCQALVKSYRLTKHGDLRDWEKCVRIATMIATKLRVTQQSVASPQVIARRKLNQQPPSVYDTDFC